MGYADLPASDMQLLESHSLLLENINTNLFDTSPEEAEGIVEFGNNLAICNHNRQRTNSAPWDNTRVYNLIIHRKNDRVIEVFLH